MKHEKFMTLISRNLLMVCLVVGACFASARAQTVIPHFDCTEPVYTNGVVTKLLAYYGYDNTTNANVVIGDGPNNFFNPNPGGQYSGHQTLNFLPGYHAKAFSILVTYPTAINWIVNNIPAKMDVTWSGYCSSGTMTYQGRLSNGTSAATGNYDLQFTLFDSLTGGTSKARIVNSAVPVASGVFTVELDVHTVFIDTDDARYLEIGVRSTGDTGLFTILSPRQPLTSVPYAIRAKQATSVSGGFVQLPLTTNAPSSLECNTSSQYGQQKFDATTSRLYICAAIGWKFTVLQ